MPTIADVEPVTELLRTLVPAESLAHGALAVVPLVAPQLPEPGWLTLAEAGDRVTIGEVSEGGSVPDVTVNNGADRPLLLLDGEELVGAKQNRILNATVLVAARSQITIPVSCVEAGRWGYRGRQLVPGDARLLRPVRAGDRGGAGRACSRVGPDGRPRVSVGAVDRGRHPAEPGRV